MAEIQPASLESQIVCPKSNGVPTADKTKQNRLITMIQQGLAGPRELGQGQ